MFFAVSNIWSKLTLSGEMWKYENMMEIANNSLYTPSGLLC